MKFNFEVEYIFVLILASISLMHGFSPRDIVTEDSASSILETKQNRTLSIKLKHKLTESEELRNCIEVCLECFNTDQSSNKVFFIFY